MKLSRYLVSLFAGAIVLLAPVAAAQAATAPASTTAAATSVSATAATLNGSLNPNGEATTWYFEYGTSTHYGTKTSVQNAGAGTATVSVSVPVTGLTTGDTYHYRLVATSAVGTGNGADQTFSTAALAAVTTGSAASVTASSAKLAGSVTPNADDTTWYFEYGTSTSYGSKTAAKSIGSGTKPINVSVSLTGLLAGTTYHFRLNATNTAGVTLGSDQSFTTIALAAVQTGAAQNVGDKTATLTGSLNPSGHSTSWYFEYGTTTGYGSRTTSRSAGSGTATVNVSEPISRLNAGVTYHFRLVATSSSGKSLGADATFTTTKAAVTLSAAAMNVVYGRYVTLSGTVSSHQSGVKVTVLAEEFGANSFGTVTTVLSGGGGAWTYLAKPGIRTTYEASAEGVTSAPVTIGVRPQLTLHVISRARFSSRAVARNSFAGHFVQLQRRSGNHWVTVKRVRLNSSSLAIFRASLLPHGTSTIRIAMSVNQAGPGYLAGFSRTLVYHR